MKIKKKLVFSVVFLSTLSWSVQAGWHHHHLPIHPGDHVFDSKRFKDSVRITAQTLQAAQNALTNWENRVTANKKIQPIYVPIQPLDTNGISLVDAKNEYKNTLFWKSWKSEDALQDSSYKSNIYEVLSSTNTETVDVLQQVASRGRERAQKMANINDISTPGILGENQKKNAIDILAILNSADKASCVGTDLMNQISKQDAATSINRLDQEQVKAGNFYAYDPYHPTAYDNNHKVSTSENIGFVKFGK